ncbi:hypothetical protein PJL18_01856 [Paenarthrobacter nicotinovorans]|nr:hypothetical protein [Paenarthrobacter nicotinovorans]
MFKGQNPALLQAGGLVLVAGLLAVVTWFRITAG